MRKGAVEITMSAVLAVIITVIVLAIVLSNFSDNFKMLMNSGKELQGKNYFAIQAQAKLCQAWHQEDFIDTVKLGIEGGFSDLGVNVDKNDNAVCMDQKTDYVNCVKKCVALLEIQDACSKLGEKCWAIDGGFLRRCDLEGCVTP
jgi:hypothetical protein